MSVQQLMISQRVSGGADTGSPPTTYSGLTFWADMDDTTRSFSNLEATTAATTDGTMIQRINSRSPTTRCVAGAGGTLRIEGTTRYAQMLPNNGLYEYFNHSPTGAAPTTYATVGNLMTNAQHVHIYLMRVIASNTDSGNPFSNDPMFYDASGYLASATYATGSTAYFDTYVEVGSGVRVVSPGFNLNQWVVVTWQHTGGQSRVRVNGGPWSTATCGNIPSTTGSPVNLIRAPPVRNVHIAQHCIYNAARTATEILSVERFFGNKVGLSF